MDEECQKTKEGERMKTKKSRSGWKNRGGEGLKKDPDLVADGGGGQQTWTVHTNTDRRNMFTGKH